MKLKLVKGNTVDEAAADENGTEPSVDINHGTKLLKQLVEPWGVKGDRVIASYSYFSYVESAKSLEDMGLVFIGVVKQTSLQYPMAHLQMEDFTCRGYCYGLVSVDEGLG